MIVHANAPLQNLHTFRVKTYARFLVELHTMDDIQALIHDASFQTLPRLILGGGSNLLFRSDFDGIVWHNQLKGISIVQEDAETIWIRAAAGEPWHDLVVFALQGGWGGIENLSLIPGCCGAAPMQNIGAYGVELKDTFHELEAIHVETGDTRIFSAADCDFGYRESIFKRKEANQWIITSITLCLQKNPSIHTGYGAIEQVLNDWGIQNPGIVEVSRAVIHIRQSKLPDPNQIGNAGSFFKNPVVDDSFFELLQKRFPQIPSYINPEGIKIPAGWLIEQCGWKGRRLGDAGVHLHQALVLVNHGLATGDEIYRLSDQIVRSVYEMFGIILEREVNIIGGSKSEAD